MSFQPRCVVLYHPGAATFFDFLTRSLRQIAITHTSRLCLVTPGHLLRDENAGRKGLKSLRLAYRALADTLPCHGIHPTVNAWRGVYFSTKDK